MGLYEKVRQRRTEKPQSRGLLHRTLNRAAPTAEPVPRVVRPPHGDQAPPVRRARSAMTPLSSAVKTASVAVAAGDVPEYVETQRPASLRSDPTPPPEADADHLLARAEALGGGIDGPAYLLQLLLEEFLPERAILLLYDNWSRGFVPCAAHGWTGGKERTISPRETRTLFSGPSPTLAAGSDLTFIEGLFGADEQVHVMCYRAEDIPTAFLAFTRVDGDRELLEVLSSPAIEQMISRCVDLTAGLGPGQSHLKSAEDLK